MSYFTETKAALLKALQYDNRPALHRLTKHNDSWWRMPLNAAGDTALHWVVRQRQLGLVTRILAHHSKSINDVNLDHETALHLAQTLPPADAIPLTQLLLQYHADLNLINRHHQRAHELGDTTVPFTLAWLAHGLIQALQHGDRAWLKSHIFPSNNLSWWQIPLNAHGETALHLAVRYQQLKTVRLMLKKIPLQDRYVDAPNAQGKTPRHYVQQQRHWFQGTALEQAHQSLVDAMAIIIKVPDEVTLVMEDTLNADDKASMITAIEQDDLTSAQQNLNEHPMLRYCSLANTTQSNGLTALHLALHDGSVAMVKLLLDTPDSIVHQRNAEGHTPSDGVVKKIDTFNHILQQTSGSFEQWWLFRLETQYAPKLPTWFERLALLVEAGAYEAMLGEDTSLPYLKVQCHAMLQAVTTQNKDWIGEQLSRFPSLACLPLNAQKETSVHLALLMEHVDLLSFILKHLPPVLRHYVLTTPTASGKLAYDYATLATLPVLKQAYVLPSAYYHPELPGETTISPANIMQALSTHSMAIFKSIHPDDPWWSQGLNPEKETPLHLALRLGHDSLVTYILAQVPVKGVLNHRNHEGQTPLHYAVRYGSAHLESMVKQGADVTIQDNQQQRADELVVSRFWPNPLRVLLATLIQHFNENTLPQPTPKYFELFKLDSHYHLLLQEKKLLMVRKRRNVNWSNKVTADTLQILMPGLAQCSYLRKLNLSHNPLGGSLRPAAMLALTKALVVLHHLESLILNDCHLNSSDLTALILGIAYPMQLRELDIQQNPLGPRGHEMLASHLETLPALTLLQLNHTHMAPLPARALYHSYQKHPKLKDLQIEENPATPEHVLGQFRALAFQRSPQARKKFTNYPLTHSLLKSDTVQRLQYWHEVNVLWQNYVAYFSEKGEDLSLKEHDLRLERHRQMVALWVQCFKETSKHRTFYQRLESNLSHLLNFTFYVVSTGQVTIKGNPVTSNLEHGAKAAVDAVVGVIEFFITVTGIAPVGAAVKAVVGAGIHFAQQAYKINTLKKFTRLNKEQAFERMVQQLAVYMTMSYHSQIQALSHAPNGNAAARLRSSVIAEAPTSDIEAFADGLTDKLQERIKGKRLGLDQPDSVALPNLAEHMVQLMVTDHEGLGNQIKHGLQAIGATLTIGNLVTEPTEEHPSSQIWRQRYLLVKPGMVITNPTGPQGHVYVYHDAMVTRSNIENYGVRYMTPSEFKLCKHKLVPTLMHFPVKPILAPPLTAHEKEALRLKARGAIECLKDDQAETKAELNEAKVEIKELKQENTTTKEDIKTLKEKVASLEGNSADSSSSDTASATSNATKKPQASANATAKKKAEMKQDTTQAPKTTPPPVHLEENNRAEEADQAKVELGLSGANSGASNALTNEVSLRNEIEGLKDKNTTLEKNMKTLTEENEAQKMTNIELKDEITKLKTKHENDIQALKTENKELKDYIHNALRQIGYPPMPNDENDEADICNDDPKPVESKEPQSPSSDSSEPSPQDNDPSATLPSTPPFSDTEESLQQEVDPFIVENNYRAPLGNILAVLSSTPSCSTPPSDDDTKEKPETTISNVDSSNEDALNPPKANL